MNTTGCGPPANKYKSNATCKERQPSATKHFLGPFLLPEQAPAPQQPTLPPWAFMGCALAHSGGDSIFIGASYEGTAKGQLQNFFVITARVEKCVWWDVVQQAASTAPREPPELCIDFFWGPGAFTSAPGKSPPIARGFVARTLFLARWLWTKNAGKQASSRNRRSAEMICAFGPTPKGTREDTESREEPSGRFSRTLVMGPCGGRAPGSLAGTEFSALLGSPGTEMQPQPRACYSRDGLKSGSSG